MPQLESSAVLPRTTMQNPFAISLQTSNASSINPVRSKPVNRSYSQNAPFDTKKTRHRFSPLGGYNEIVNHQSRHRLSWNALNLGLDPELWAQFLGVSGCWGAKEVEVEGTKTRAKRNEKGSPTHPQPQASSHPILNKEGSAICDWFLVPFSERRVSPCQDSTDM